MKKVFPKIIIPIIGIIVGVVSIIIGIVSSDFNLHYRGTVAAVEYGGDAYTGIQNACAKTANNAYHIYELMQTFCKFFFIVLGILIILHYVEKMLEKIKSLKNKTDSIN